MEDWDADFKTKEEYGKAYDTVGDIDASFMWIMKNGTKAQKTRAMNLANTFIKRLHKINEEIED